MLIETDAPFLSPEPFRGRSNAPYLVPVTLRFMAAELETDINELAHQLNANTERVYGSWAEGR
jgi:TatD DNase family protein